MRVSSFSLAIFAAATGACKPSQSVPTTEPSAVRESATAPGSAAGSAAVGPTASVSAILPNTAPIVANGAPLKTFAAIRDLSHEHANFAISTYSLERCLGLLALGAKGKTAQELLAYLHTDNLASWLANSAAGASAGKGQVTFNESNGVWVQKSLPLAADFQRDIAANKATVESLDFASKPDEARLRINQKVSEQTQTKIPELLPGGVIMPSTRTVLTNAIYFLGTWQTAFEVAKTRDESFTTSDGKSVQVPMMNAAITVPGGKYALGSAAGSTGIAVSLPYSGSSYALLLVVPDGPLAAFEDALAGDTVINISKALKTEGKLALAMPKFEIRSGGFVHPALAKAGLPLAMSENADYHGITAREALTVSAVVHQVFIKVDEHGTEAAAATAVVMAPGGAAPKLTPLRFDRPFFFAVYNKNSGTTLFSGHVGNPLESAGTTSARRAP
jgi:serine protease inhibitor